MASLWKLPAIFVCQNNGFAEHSRFQVGTAADRISDRASSYRMSGVSVDGNDPAQMWSAAHDAVERARSGRGPTLIEARTFRFMGHVMGDQSEYIPKEEMQAALARDPVPALRSSLIAEHRVKESELFELESAIAREIDDAVEFALGSGYPDPKEIRRDVYAAELPS